MKVTPDQPLNTLELFVPTPYSGWVECVPISYSDTDAGTDYTFNVKLKVPSDAPGGPHEFLIEVIGNGATLLGSCRAHIGLGLLQLTPATATNTVGDTHEVKATYTVGGYAQANIWVEMNVVSGPNAGVGSFEKTDANGQVSMSYTGSVAGTDVIEAKAYSDDNKTTVWATASPVEKVWEEEAPAPVPGLSGWGIGLSLLGLGMGAVLLTVRRRRIRTA